MIYVIWIGDGKKGSYLITNDRQDFRLGVSIAHKSAQAAFDSICDDGLPIRWNVIR